MIRDLNLTQGCPCLVNFIFQKVEKLLRRGVILVLILISSFLWELGEVEMLETLEDSESAEFMIRKDLPDRVCTFDQWFPTFYSMKIR